MTTTRHTAVTVIAAFTALLCSLTALRAQESETITSFNVRIEIDPEDASLYVTESITVTAAGDRIKRGIYRDFPTLNQGPFGLRKPVTFEVVSVLRDGDPEPFSLEGLQDGQRVRIGDAAKTLAPGSHTYTLVYRTTGQLRTFATYDELYWNATGHGWDFPIVLTRVEVVVPEGAEIIVDDDLRPAAYLGTPGTGENAEDYTYSQERDHVAIFQSTRTILPGEGLTVAVPFTKGTVNHPGGTVATLLKANWAYLLGAALVLGALVFHIGAWVAAGKDPAPGSIHPQPVPPEGFSPAACRYLKNMGFDQKCFTAAILGLASKNALRITGDPDSSFTLRHPDTSAKKAPLTPDEDALAKNLLHNRESLTLEPSSHRQVSAARDKLKSVLASRLEKTHFVRNIHLWVPGLLATLVGVSLSLFNASMAPTAFFLTLWLTIWSVGCTLLLSTAITAIKAKNWGPAIGMSLFSVPFVAGWVIGFWFLGTSVGPATMVLLFAGAAFNFLFYHLIKAPTHAGRDVLDEIEGFQEYLNSTDLESPDDTGNPDTTFSRYLPYAIALDCETGWEQKFAAALSRSAASPSTHRPFHPHWYSGNLHGAAFGSAIAAAMTTSLSAASSSQSSSSSSGSSGGGSSGGGGGGGGGGGW